MSETRTHAETGKRMMVWAVIVFGVGLLSGFGSTEVLIALNPSTPLLSALVATLSRVILYFGMPLAASLLVGGMLLRQLGSRSE
ncbi:hypothetical protein FM113_06725 [Leucobacter sp. 7(1)]|uniref:hypothetical protein n=1 Tax=Leucobacter sp. 7(1) TaxID=1255613 RepID=UPI00097F226A|nr:hypothetical protein [Leucobacter sp. 7(1)]SJN09614.1 hypothetical protein FM113_06725 [Leucobacter sp. 7(1)]